MKKNDLKNIRFIGKLEKKQAMFILSKCDVLYKGHPNIELYKYGLSAVKLAEYLYSGKPIIHAVNMINEPVSISSSGVCILPENEIELKKAILELEENKIFYKRCCNNGLKFIEENFMEEKIKEKLKKAMDQI